MAIHSLNLAFTVHPALFNKMLYRVTIEALQRDLSILFISTEQSCSLAMNIFIKEGKMVVISCKKAT